MKKTEKKQTGNIRFEEAKPQSMASPKTSPYEIFCNDLNELFNIYAAK